MDTNVFTGISSGTFDALTLYRSGAYQDLNVILNGLGGGGGAVTSATLPLSISNGVLSINLAAYSDTVAMNSAISTALSVYIPTTHEANKIGAADASHGQFNFETMTLTLKNGAGVTAQLSVGNSGDVSIGADGVLTVSMLNGWDFTTIKIKDSLNISRNLTASLTGQLVWNQSSLVDLNYLTTQLATKQDSLSYYSESVAAPTYYVHTQEAATPPIYLSWQAGAYVNNVGYQEITIYVYHGLTGLPTSGQLLYSMDLQAGTANEVVLATNDASWTNWTETENGSSLE